MNNLYHSTDSLLASSTSISFPEAPIKKSIRGKEYILPRRQNKGSENERRFSDAADFEIKIAKDDDDGKEAEELAAERKWKQRLKAGVRKVNRVNSSEDEKQKDSVYCEDNIIYVKSAPASREVWSSYMRDNSQI